MNGDVNEMATAWVDAFTEHADGAFIANAATQMVLHRWGALQVPMTVNSGEANGTFVCCPRVGWVDFIREELAHFPDQRLVPVLRAVVKAIERLARASDLDRIVHVNNWMVSTNPTVGLDPEICRAQTNELSRTFPKHILAVRSLTRRHNAALIDGLSAEGWVMLPARQVFIVDDVAKDSLPRRDAKNDARLWAKGEFRFEELTEMSREDAIRIAQLYDMLYVQKYSSLNPKYTPEFIRLAHRVGLIRFLVLRDRSGVLQAFGGMLHVGKCATMPLLGYNTDIDQKKGLYRLACHAGSLYAARNHLSYNMSSGVATFKKTRGATGEIEYTAYYVRHLPLRRRWPFGLLRAIGHHIGIPILRKYAL